ncbi:hypothetical protein [Synechococcus sp. MIT S9220]|nr:hypothetical protein [Synechococcus sp. MIT S9220]
MKRIAAVIAGLLIPIPSVQAGETWVMASWEMHGKPKPGTIAEEYNWWGLGYYIDLQSVVKKGDLVFYYDGWVPLDSDKRPTTGIGWNNKESKPKDKFLRIANCKTLEFKAYESANFKQADPAYRPLIKFACSE